MLTKLALSMSIGAVMGLLTHIKRNKTIKKPRNTKRTYDPGFLTDVAFGSVAALAVVIVSDPNGIERVILTAILGGYAGENAIARLEANNQVKNVEALKQVQAEQNSELLAPAVKQEQK